MISGINQIPVWEKKYCTYSDIENKNSWNGFGNEQLFYYVLLSSFLLCVECICNIVDDVCSTIMLLHPLV